MEVSPKQSAASKQTSQALPHLPRPLQASKGHNHPPTPVLRLNLTETENIELEYLGRYGLTWYDINQDTVSTYIAKMKENYFEMVHNLRKMIRALELQNMTLQERVDVHHLRLRIPTSPLTSHLSKAIEASFDRWNLTRAPCQLNFQIHRNLVISHGGETFAPTLAIYPKLPKAEVLMDGIVDEFAGEVEHNDETMEIDPSLVIEGSRHPSDIAFWTQYKGGMLPSIVLLVQEVRNPQEMKQVCVDLASIWFGLSHLKLLLIAFVFPTMSEVESVERILIVGIHAMDTSHTEILCSHPETDSIPSSSQINVEGITYSDLPFRSSQEWELDAKFLNQFMVASM